VRTPESGDLGRRQVEDRFEDRGGVARRLPGEPHAGIDSALTRQDVEQRAGHDRRVAKTGREGDGPLTKPDRDRGHYGELADLYEQGGSPDRAQAILVEAVARYPEEFTFHFQLAQHLLARGLASEALPSAQAAYDHSYGDNRLRAAKTLAVALHGAGRDADAVAVVDRALAEAHRPAEDQKVRTFRYLDALVATRADITKASSPK